MKIKIMSRKAIEKHCAVHLKESTAIISILACATKRTSGLCDVKTFTQ